MVGPTPHPNFDSPDGVISVNVVMAYQGKRSFAMSKRIEQKYLVGQQWRRTVGMTLVFVQLHWAP